MKPKNPNHNSARNTSSAQITETRKTEAEKEQSKEPVKKEQMKTEDENLTWYDPIFEAPKRIPAAVHEAMAAYGRRDERSGEYPPFPRQGTYTLQDYFALPEERRVELIDGVFYDMSAPTTIHQAIGGFIHSRLINHVLDHGGQCMPLMSPVDVQLDEDDRTMVQPDVLIVCTRSRFRHGRVFGAPDFLVEVLSPSTSRKDKQLKLRKYKNAGVREYWIVDPRTRTVIVHDLEHQSIPVLYGREDTIPVGIWGGTCAIPMKELFDHIEFLYD